MVYGISVAEKKIVWLKLRAEGVAGHGSQPTDTNPNDRLVKALARLLAPEGTRAPQAPASRPGEPTVIDMMQAKVGAFAQNKFTNAIQHSTISLTWFRSGVGDPPKINVIPSVAEAGLDCRVLPGTTRDQWIAEIGRRLGDPAIKIELINESDDPVVTTQRCASLPQHRGRHQAQAPRGDRHADPHPVRHRLERLPPAGA